MCDGRGGTCFMIANNWSWWEKGCLMKTGLSTAEPPLLQSKWGIVDIWTTVIIEKEGQGVFRKCNVQEKDKGAMLLLSLLQGWRGRMGGWVNLFIQGRFSECWSHASTRRSTWKEFQIPNLRILPSGSPSDIQYLWLREVHAKRKGETC